ncbi:MULTISPECIES: hypothetical protein [unclassified Streptomyces]|uniref:hypothetical protein n=1 Tax=unclassified Streptomyces TaxID=2593676 RepID=UPI0004B15A0F|nr:MULTISPECIES: hypothetical protein [unclassified Streptomyces]
MGGSRDEAANGRKRRLQYAALSGAAAMAVPATAAAVALGTKGGLPWWVVAAVGVVTAGLAGWTGARIGRRRGIHDEALEPGEQVVGTYTARPTTTEHTPPAAHEGPQHQLRVTSGGVEMWERSVLLWRHPWTELRLPADGPRLRIHPQGREAGTMLLERPGAVGKILLTAKAHGAA